ncbi:unnamed protein product [Amoebophrya sp. A25]|nr:unnamed protein product [Amoebophrya sp. A25]|eukprot:GSA25T00013977001.1
MPKNKKRNNSNKKWAPAKVSNSPAPLPVPPPAVLGQEKHQVESTETAAGLDSATPLANEAELDASHLGLDDLNHSVGSFQESFHTASGYFSAAEQFHTAHDSALHSVASSSKNSGAGCAEAEVGEIRAAGNEEAKNNAPDAELSSNSSGTDNGSSQGIISFTCSVVKQNGQENVDERVADSMTSSSESNEEELLGRLGESPLEMEGLHCQPRADNATSSSAGSGSEGNGDEKERSDHENSDQIVDESSRGSDSAGRHEEPIVSSSDSAAEAKGEASHDVASSDVAPEAEQETPFAGNFMRDVPTEGQHQMKGPQSASGGRNSSEDERSLNIADVSFGGATASATEAYPGDVSGGNAEHDTTRKPTEMQPPEVPASRSSRNMSPGALEARAALHELKAHQVMKEKHGRGAVSPVDAASLYTTPAPSAITPGGGRTSILKSTLARKSSTSEQEGTSSSCGGSEPGGVSIPSKIRRSGSGARTNAANPAASPTNSSNVTVRAGASDVDPLSAVGEQSGTRRSSKSGKSSSKEDSISIIGDREQTTVDSKKSSQAGPQEVMNKKHNVIGKLNLEKNTSSRSVEHLQREVARGLMAGEDEEEEDDDVLDDAEDGRTGRAVPRHRGYYTSERLQRYAREYEESEEEEGDVIEDVTLNMLSSDALLGSCLETSPSAGAGRAGGADQHQPEETPSCSSREGEETPSSKRDSTAVSASGTTLRTPGANREDGEGVSGRAPHHPGTLPVLSPEARKLRLRGVPPITQSQEDRADDVVQEQAQGKTAVESAAIPASPVSSSSFTDQAISKGPVTDVFPRPDEGRTRARAEGEAVSVEEGATVNSYSAIIDSLNLDYAPPAATAAPQTCGFDRDAERFFTRELCPSPEKMEMINLNSVEEPAGEQGVCFFDDANADRSSEQFSARSSAAGGGGKSSVFTVMDENGRPTELSEQEYRIWLRRPTDANHEEVELTPRTQGLIITDEASTSPAQEPTLHPKFQRRRESIKVALPGVVSEFKTSLVNEVGYPMRGIGHSQFVYTLNTGDLAPTRIAAPVLKALPTDIVRISSANASGFFPTTIVQTTSGGTGGQGKDAKAATGDKNQHKGAVAGKQADPAAVQEDDTNKGKVKDKDSAPSAGADKPKYDRSVSAQEFVQSAGQADASKKGSATSASGPTQAQLQPPPLRATLTKPAGISRNMTAALQASASCFGHVVRRSSEFETTADGMRKNFKEEVSTSKKTSMVLCSPRLSLPPSPLVPAGRDYQVAPAPGAGLLGMGSSGAGLHLPEHHIGGLPFVPLQTIAQPRISAPPAVANDRGTPRSKSSSGIRSRSENTCREAAPAQAREGARPRQPGTVAEHAAGGSCFASPRSSCTPRHVEDMNKITHGLNSAAFAFKRESLQVRPMFAPKISTVAAVAGQQRDPQGEGEASAQLLHFGGIQLAGGRLSLGGHQKQYLKSTVQQDCEAEPTTTSDQATAQQKANMQSTSEMHPILNGTDRSMENPAGMIAVSAMRMPSKVPSLGDSQLVYGEGSELENPWADPDHEVVEDLAEGAQVEGGDKDFFGMKAAVEQIPLHILKNDENDYNIERARMITGEPGTSASRASSPAQPPGALAMDFLKRNSKASTPGGGMPIGVQSARGGSTICSLLQQAHFHDRLSIAKQARAAAATDRLSATQERASFTMPVQPKAPGVGWMPTQALENFKRHANSVGLDRPTLDENGFLVLERAEFYDASDAEGEALLASSRNVSPSAGGLSRTIENANHSAGEEDERGAAEPEDGGAKGLTASVGASTKARRITDRATLLDEENEDELIQASSISVNQVQRSQSATAGAGQGRRCILAHVVPHLRVSKVLDAHPSEGPLKAPINLRASLSKPPVPPAPRTRAPTAEREDQAPATYEEGGGDAPSERSRLQPPHLAFPQLRPPGGPTMTAADAVDEARRSGGGQLLGGIAPKIKGLEPLAQIVPNDEEEERDENGETAREREARLKREHIEKYDLCPPKAITLSAPIRVSMDFFHEKGHHAHIARGGMALAHAKTNFAPIDETAHNIFRPPAAGAAATGMSVPGMVPGPGQCLLQESHLQGPQLFASPRTLQSPRGLLDFICDGANNEQQAFGSADFQMNIEDDQGGVVNEAGTAATSKKKRRSESNARASGNRRPSTSGSGRGSVTGRPSLPASTRLSSTSPNKGPTLSRAALAPPMENGTVEAGNAEAQGTAVGVLIVKQPPPTQIDGFVDVSPTQPTNGNVAAPGIMGAGLDLRTALGAVTVPQQQGLLAAADGQIGTAVTPIQLFPPASAEQQEQAAAQPSLQVPGLIFKPMSARDALKNAMVRPGDRNYARNSIAHAHDVDTHMPLDFLNSSTLSGNAGSRSQSKTSVDDGAGGAEYHAPPRNKLLFDGTGTTGSGGSTVTSANNRKSLPGGTSSLNKLRQAAKSVEAAVGITSKAATRTSLPVGSLNGRSPPPSLSSNARMKQEQVVEKQRPLQQGGASKPPMAPPPSGTTVVEQDEDESNKLLDWRKPGITKRASVQPGLADDHHERFRASINTKHADIRMRMTPRPLPNATELMASTFSNGGTDNTTSDTPHQLGSLKFDLKLGQTSRVDVPGGGRMSAPGGTAVGMTPRAPASARGDSLTKKSTSSKAARTRAARTSVGKARVVSSSSASARAAGSVRTSSTKKRSPSTTSKTKQRSSTASTSSAAATGNKNLTSRSRKRSSSPKGSRKSRSGGSQSSPTSSVGDSAKKGRKIKRSFSRSSSKGNTAKASSSANKKSADGATAARRSSSGFPNKKTSTTFSAPKRGSTSAQRPQLFYEAEQVIGLQAQAFTPGARPMNFHAAPAFPRQPQMPSTKAMTPQPLPQMPGMTNMSGLYAGYSDYSMQARARMLQQYCDFRPSQHEFLQEPAILSDEVTDKSGCTDQDHVEQHDLDHDTGSGSNANTSVMSTTPQRLSPTKSLPPGSNGKALKVALEAERKANRREREQARKDRIASRSEQLKK